MTQPTKTSFTANEPVVVASFVAWLFSLLGTFILGHTDLVSSDTWSGLSTTLVPVASALVLAGLAWVTRKFVAPAWKLLTDKAGKVGVTDEFLKQAVADATVKELLDLKLRYPQLAAVIDHVLVEKGAASGGAVTGS